MGGPAQHFSAPWFKCRCPNSDTKCTQPPFSLSNVVSQILVHRYKAVYLEYIKPKKDNKKPKENNTQLRKTRTPKENNKN